MSPRSFLALLERHDAQERGRERLEFLRTGILASVMANGLLKREDERPFVPADFMPGEKVEEENADPLKKGELQLMKFRKVAGG